VVWKQMTLNKLNLSWTIPRMVLFAEAQYKSNFQNPTNVMGKSWEFAQDVYTCFVDLEKA